MKNSKESIRITITDIDDLDKVFKALDIFFRKILMHYADKNKEKEIEKFVLTISAYFGILLKKLGYDEGMKDE